ncbi:MAG: hypothetical protein WD871_02125 [Xanthobacteraceae bacterium]
MATHTGLAQTNDRRRRLTRIAPEVFDEPLDPARLKIYLAEPNHLMLAALAGGEVAV